MRILAILVLTLALSACNTNVDSLPDVTTTGQVVVVFTPDQWAELRPGACDAEDLDDPVGGMDTTSPTGRIYYGLAPGAYCLRSGTFFSGGVMVTGALTLDIVAGAIQYVSVIPVQLEPV